MQPALLHVTQIAQMRSLSAAVPDEHVSIWQFSVFRNRGNC
jgi:hypothetical protein